MPSDRRIGGPDAKNRGVLLDAAEQLMLDEGYAAVTSRRVADRAGLKPQLVHYYFRTMDEMFAEVFRRRATQAHEALAAALQSNQPLWALWDFGTDPQTTQFTLEFMGLASRREALRTEFAVYAERFRELQTDAMTAALQRHGYDFVDVPPVVWAVFATSISQVLVLERTLGVTSGHAEMLAFCEDWLRRFEGERLPADAAASSTSTSPVP